MSIDQTLQERCELMIKSFEDTYKRQLCCSGFFIGTGIARYGTDPTAKMHLCIQLRVQSLSEQARNTEEVLDRIRKKLPEHYGGIPVVVKEVGIPQIES